MRDSLLLVCLLCFCAPSLGQVGSPYCFGNGCPCGNDDPSAGCGNFGVDGNGASGALLSASGSADVWFDDLLLTVEGVRPGEFGVVFMGSAIGALPAGDGLRCVGAGANGLWRFPVAQADGNGAFSVGSIISGSHEFDPPGWIDAGESWSFQAWYRDGGGPCGSGSNYTNALSVTFQAPGTQRPVEADFAGRPLARYPFFERVQALNQGEDLFAALDPTRLPWLVGATGDLFIVADKSRAEWDSDPSLVDVRATGPQTWTIQAGGIQADTLRIDTGTLNGTQGEAVGVGYDIVFDVDQDGLLGPGDVIDGRGDEAGVSVVRDTAAPGPHAVTEVLYNGGTWLRQDIYYPSDIAGLGELPLMVVSHGNGHDYTWYDHIGYHMASYGWVVMSHSNNTGPGIETASETTLSNTDHLLGNLATIAGGVLDGHVDGHTIVWIGHSRGAEGVVRAYDRLFDGNYVPANYGLDDIQLVSSIAPTTFLSPQKTKPHKVNFHLWVGSADNDVWGAPNSGPGQSFPILERAGGEKACTVIQGAGHAVFHDGGGPWVAEGPCLVGPKRVHKIMRGYLLPLTAYFIRHEADAKDFLWRQYETFQPIGAPKNNDGCIVVNLEYHARGKDRYVIDDFQSEPATTLSSSGQPVTYDLTDLEEGRLQDANTSLEWETSDPFNGMTRARATADDPRGIVFTFDGPSYLEFSVDPEHKDWTDAEALSFRACQCARHPSTQAALGDIDLRVVLVDSHGRIGQVEIGAFGGGIEEPYQRISIGTSPGWANEFETIRIRLTDFLTDGSGLDLALIQAVRFEFGLPGSEVGRLGFDDLELVTHE